MSSESTLPPSTNTPNELIRTLGTYIYYTRFPHDKKDIKYTVGVLWAVDTAITTLISHTIYRYLITDFMLPFSQLVTTSTFVAEEALSVFLALLIQCLYAFRLFTLSGRRSDIPTAIILLALAAFALNFASVAKMTNQMMFSQVVSQSVKLIKSLCWGLSVGADLLITLSNFWYFARLRTPGWRGRRGGLRKSLYTA
ncbi:hypothetical protein BC628DRAFT_712376 [Trametes gibbosa]|nr:hypothetical protein BC628DRAFT_712376 [Trametes gibbosa]